MDKGTSIHSRIKILKRKGVSTGEKGETKGEGEKGQKAAVSARRLWSGERKF